MPPTKTARASGCGGRGFDRGGIDLQNPVTDLHLSAAPSRLNWVVGRRGRRFGKNLRLWLPSRALPSASSHIVPAPAALTLRALTQPWMRHSWAAKEERAINKLGDKLAVRLIAGLSEEKDYSRLEPK